MTKRFDAEGILSKLAEIRRSVPASSAPAKTKGESRFDARTADEFELAAVAEACDALANEIQAVADEAYESAFEQALDVYYAAEELARDPVHAEVAAHVENMRKAYEEAYGRTIPTKEETEKRRAGGKHDTAGSAAPH